MGHGLSLFFDSKSPVNLFFGLETILKYQHATMTNECYANHLLFYRCTRTGMLPFCASHGHRWAALVVARIRTTHLRMLNVVRKTKQNLAENVQSGICSWIGTFVSRGSDPVQDFTRNLLLVRRHWVYIFYILFLIKLETRFCWRWVPQRNDWVVYPCLCPFLMYEKSTRSAHSAAGAPVVSPLLSYITLKAFITESSLWTLQQIRTNPGRIIVLLTPHPHHTCLW